MDFLDQWYGTHMTETVRPPYETALDQGDDAGAIRHLLVAVREGDAHAMVGLGTMLLLGRGIEQDRVDGIAWIRQGALQGNALGMRMLAAVLLSGTGCIPDEGEVAYWYYKAGLLGSTEAVDALGLLLRSPSLIGEHFTREESMALMRDAHRLRVVH
jgi:TPR repeat protein